jgi:DNA-binding NtrC family response regulator
VLALNGLSTARSYTDPEPAAETGAIYTPRAPPSLEAIEPLQRIQEFHAARKEPIVNIPMVATSPKMQEVFRRIERVLQTTATVLITVEPATGKGMIASIIHDQGSRRQGPFIAMNCATIPETLLEAEFFSHIQRAAGAPSLLTGSPR